MNAYRYAKDRYWDAIGGMHWTGDDPDFLPVYLASGPGREGCNVWDFTEAVKFWIDGKRAKHGFMLRGDSKDWFRAYYREAETVKDRPAPLVAYEPKWVRGVRSHGRAAAPHWDARLGGRDSEPPSRSPRISNPDPRVFTCERLLSPRCR